ncbi:MDR family MFS transporter [Uliginosibacterium flavum]|uniref:DHA2 family efflux MFS transporter permease subunit n=1 Tax=Uliginosibacterium flavum TaxID=1396831 RepID=A0ABV2TGZ7_9RHOO
MKPILPGWSLTATPEAILAKRFIIAMTVTLGCVLELVDTSIVNVAVPHMMGTLGATLDEITWVSIGYVIANVIVLPLSGFLSHLFGRRNYFILSILVFTLASLACGNASSLGSLVFWRIVQGLGGGGLIATAQSTIFEVFPRKEIGNGMAIFGMGIMTGPMLGPTLGGWLTDQYSWPWIFYINLPLGLIALVLTLLYVPESKHRQKIESIDYLGILLLAVGVGTLQLFLERGERLDWFASWEIIFYAVCSLASIGSFIIRQLEIDHPVVNLRVCKDAQFSAGLVITFLLGASLFATVFVFPVYVQTLMGYTAWQTGMLILPSALASGLAMPIVSKLINRGVSARGIVVLGAMLFLYSMWGHYQFSTESGAADFLPPLILRGLGLGMLFMPLNSLTLANIAPAERAGATGLYNLTRQLGGSVGIAISATLLVSLSNSKRAILGEHIAGNSESGLLRLAMLKARLLATGIPESMAQLKAYALLSLQIGKQAQMLSFATIFLLFGLAMVGILPLLWLMKKQSVTAGPDAH